MSQTCSECGQIPAGDTCPVKHPLCPQFDYVPPGDNSAVLAPDSIVGGRYRVSSVLGKGGFGTVFAAQHVTTKQDVVVKVLNAQVASDRTQVQRFFNEARMTSQLTHPHTVRVYDFGHTDAGALFIVMERLNGREMGEVLKAEKKFSAIRVMRIATAVLRSLAEAHETGLVHRDLKPSNIFLCEVHGHTDFVKLLDFGIAKDTESEDEADLTKTGFALGTPKYMSPEQGRAEKLDRRSDLYSLGIIMYEALCGAPPFTAKSGMALIVKHLQEAPQPLSQRVEGLPTGLSEIVMTALQKHPGSRFYDADDMRAAIEMVMERAGEPVASNKRAQTAAVRGLTPADVMSAAAVMDGNETRAMEVGADDETRDTRTPAATLAPTNQPKHPNSSAAPAPTVMAAAPSADDVHQAATTAIPTPIATAAVPSPTAPVSDQTFQGPAAKDANPWKAAAIGGGLAVLCAAIAIPLLMGRPGEPAQAEAPPAAAAPVATPPAAKTDENPAKPAEKRDEAATEAADPAQQAAAEVDAGEGQPDAGPTPAEAAPAAKPPVAPAPPPAPVAQPTPAPKNAPAPSKPARVQPAPAKKAPTAAKPTRKRTPKKRRKAKPKETDGDVPL